MIFIINTVVFLFLAIIWNKSDWHNLLFKVVFFCVTFTNAFYALQAYGYIVKAV